MSEQWLSEDDLEWVKKRVSRLEPLDFSELRSWEKTPHSFDAVDRHIADRLATEANVEKVRTLISQAFLHEWQSQEGKRLGKNENFQVLILDLTMVFYVHHLARLLVWSKTYAGVTEIEIADLGATYMEVEELANHGMKLRLAIEGVKHVVQAFKDFLDAEYDKEQLKGDESGFLEHIRLTTEDGMIDSMFGEFWQSDQIPNIILSNLFAVVAALAHEMQHVRQFVFDPEFYNSAPRFPAEAKDMALDQVRSKFPDLVKAYYEGLAEIHAEKLALRYLLYLRERHNQGIFPLAELFLAMLNEKIDELKREIAERLAARKQSVPDQDWDWINDLSP
jgi:hypothetical protein